jgi:hypothetical protein
MGEMLPVQQSMSTTYHLFGHCYPKRANPSIPLFRGELINQLSSSGQPETLASLPGLGDDDPFAEKIGQRRKSFTPVG